MQKILTARERTVSFIGVVLIVGAGVFAFFIEPACKEHAALDTEIKITKMKMLRYSRLLAHKEHLRQAYTSLASGIAVSLEQDSGIISTLATLERLAKESGVSIIDIRPQAVKGTGTHGEIVVDLKLEGTLDKYIHFIYSLDRAPVLLRVTRFQINAKPNSTSLEGVFSVVQLSVRQ